MQSENSIFISESRLLRLADVPRSRGGKALQALGINPIVMVGRLHLYPVHAAETLKRALVEETVAANGGALGYRISSLKANATLSCINPHSASMLDETDAANREIWERIHAVQGVRGFAGSALPLGHLPLF